MYVELDVMYKAWYLKACLKWNFNHDIHTNTSITIMFNRIHVFYDALRKWPTMGFIHVYVGRMKKNPSSVLPLIPTLVGNSFVNPDKLCFYYFDMVIWSKNSLSRRSLHEILIWWLGLLIACLHNFSMVFVEMNGRYEWHSSTYSILLSNCANGKIFLLANIDMWCVLVLFLTTFNPKEKHNA